MIKGTYNEMIINRTNYEIPHEELTSCIQGGKCWGKQKK